jgi:hypothetical protein
MKAFEYSFHATSFKPLSFFVQNLTASCNSIVCLTRQAKETIVKVNPKHLQVYKSSNFALYILECQKSTELPLNRANLEH